MNSKDEVMDGERLGTARKIVLEVKANSKENFGKRMESKYPNNQKLFHNNRKQTDSKKW